MSTSIESLSEAIKRKASLSRPEIKNDLTVSWNPAEGYQQNGRRFRQENLHTEVVTQSLTGNLSLVNRKAKFIDQVYALENDTALAIRSDTDDSNSPGM